VMAITTTSGLARLYALLLTINAGRLLKGTYIFDSLFWSAAR
jgi:hypothetical protein